MSPTSLKGCKLLIVENDALNAQLVVFQLEDEGCEIIGPAATVADALALYRKARPDVVMLDYRLNGETVDAVADLLEAEGTPYLLVTGALPPQHAERFPHARTLIKPFRSQQLIDQLNAALQSASRA